MARHEADREDLMAEATALIERFEMSMPEEAELVTAGFRKTGFLSIYFEQDPAYHFDDRGQLRRAYADGYLYRTAGNTLSRLKRERTPLETNLLRHDLTNDELQAFLESMKKRLSNLLHQLNNEALQIKRQIPTKKIMTTKLATALENILRENCPLAPRISAR